MSDKMPCTHETGCENSGSLVDPRNGAGLLCKTHFNKVVKDAAKAEEAEYAEEARIAANHNRDEDA